MLYDVEFIAPYTREGRPVYLVGDLWVQEDNLPKTVKEGNKKVCLREAWKTALQHLQIGGERTYGWGRLRLVKLKARERERDSGSLEHWGNGWKWEGVKNAVIIQRDAPQEKEHIRLPVHALAVDANLYLYKAVAPLQGPVEPVLGWERKQGRYALSSVAIMYEPGAQVPSGFSAYLHPWGWVAGSPPKSPEKPCAP